MDVATVKLAAEAEKQRIRHEGTLLAGAIRKFAHILLNHFQSACVSHDSVYIAAEQEQEHLRQALDEARQQLVRRVCFETLWDHCKQNNLLGRFCQVTCRTKVATSQQQMDRLRTEQAEAMEELSHRFTSELEVAAQRHEVRIVYPTI